MNQEKKDVVVKVNRLNLNDRTPEDTIAEKAIIEAMSKKEVRVVVIHKPSNDFAQFKCKLPEVRAKATEVVQKHADKLHSSDLRYDLKLSDYIIMEVEPEEIRVTHL